VDYTITIEIHLDNFIFITMRRLAINYLSNCYERQYLSEIRSRNERGENAEEYEQGAEGQ
jgi:hypothetical protein